MNRLLCAASIIACAAPAVAVAQPNDNHQHQGQHGGRPQNAGGGARQAPNTSGRPGGQHQQAQMAPQPHMAPQAQSAPTRPSRGARETVNGGPRIYSAPGQHATARSANIQPVHAGTFRYPRGYHYRRWSVGLVLPTIFLTNYYFYNDWAALGAYPPPRGFVWVRYGPDLLLVNRYSGRIRDVIYGAFY